MRSILSVFVHTTAWCCVAALGAAAVEPTVDDADLPRLAPLANDEALASFAVSPGLRVEVAAAEPEIADPIAMSFDESGALYVVEMRDYSERRAEKLSRVKRLTDRDGDGRFETATVFLDGLAWATGIACWNGGVFVAASPDIVFAKDTDGDGVADEKKIVFENPAIDSRNLEHQNGGFYWNLDNWIYPSRDNLRYKYKNGKLLADTLVDNMIGQWGLTADNYGKLFYSEAGPGLPAVQIQQMPAYGSLNFRDQYTEDFTVLWPVIGNVDAQGGPRALREDSSLIRFTSGTGQSIYRGDRWPGSMLGDYFIPEPVGRVIKRGKVINRNGKISIESAYQQKDWLASADMNFRPINTYTGPDGCFYIVDMYHGIIQEGEWTPPDSYLGKKIVELGLDKNKGMGRIYRVVHKNVTPDNTKPNMLNESASQLATYLSHPNGWWRDMAQQTIILRNDKSVVPQLKKIATENPLHLARIHALWTLEGLESLDKETLFSALADTNAHVRKSAVWASELFIQQKDEEVISRLEKLVADSNADVRIQLMLSLRGSKEVKAQTLVKELLDTNPANELMQFSYKMFEETKVRTEAEAARLKNLSPADRALVTKGATHYKQLCSNCHGADGKGILMGSNPMPAPPLVGSARVTGDKIALIQLMLMGLQGPVDGKEYPNTMPPMAGNSDEYLASVLSYIRNSSDFGNKASVITIEEVQAVRGFTKHMPPGGTTLRSLEIGKLGRAERQNWDAKK